MIRTNIALLGLLALGCSTGCAATLQPSGTVYTTYYSPEVAVVEEPVVVVERPVVFPLFPLLVSYHHHPAPRPVVHHPAPVPRVHHAAPLRPTQPSHQVKPGRGNGGGHSVKPGNGGGKPSHSGGKK